MTESFLTTVTTPAHWLVVAATLTMVVLSVALHDAALSRLNQWLGNWHPPAQSRLLMLILMILCVHVIEIWIFGAGSFLVTQVPGTGSISGTEPLRLLDAVYLSAVSFSTVGYGDVVPRGGLRLIFATEALMGLVLITWSASFTYLEMQRYWRVK